MQLSERKVHVLKEEGWRKARKATLAFLHERHLMPYFIILLHNKFMLNPHTFFLPLKSNS